LHRLRQIHLMIKINQFSLPRAYKIHVDFKECIKKYVEPKPIEIAEEKEDLGKPLVIPDDFS
jgi:hypothetical protein